MKVVFLVCKKDIEMFRASIAWMTKLCGEQDYHAVVYYDGVKQLDLPKMPFKNVSYQELDYSFLPYPCVTNVSFARIAKDMEEIGESFLFSEPDVAVLKHDWVARLEAEFKRGNGCTLVTGWSQPPDDMSCGVGIHKKSTYSCYLSAITNSGDGFDGGLFRNHSRELHKTLSIHHCYGKYIGGKVFAPEFTVNQLEHLMRGDAALYHKVYTTTFFERLERFVKVRD